MFLISVISVILSSYLTAACIPQSREQKGKTGFLYFLLISFAQIVLSFEVLSLLNSISKNGFLICSIVFLITAAIIKRHCEPANAGAAIQTMKEILNALKRDKALTFLSVCFILFLIFQLITIFLFPVTFGDALAYYISRGTAWIQNGSINHYLTSNTHELMMPVNMDFLYTWLLLFRKSEAGAGIFAFIGYSGAVYVIYNLLKELNFSIKRCLWAVFAFSSFSLVIAETMHPCADLTAGALILGAVYLFIKASKYDDKTALYFSALSCALSIGVKTTALIAAPSVFLIFCTVSYIYKKNCLLKFCLFFIFNFAVFSSYSYILNFLDFGSFASPSEEMLIHEFKGGIKGYFANIIKYSFAFFDMSGMPEFLNFNDKIQSLLNAVLNMSGLTILDGASKFFPVNFIYNNQIGIFCSLFGLTGLLIFLPSLIYSIKRGFKRRKSQAAVIIGVLAFSFILNLLIFSGVLVFASYNMKYFLTFAVIAAPVPAYSYPLKHRFYKSFLCFLIFWMLVINTHQYAVSYLFECIRQKTVKIDTSLPDEKIDLYRYFLKKQPSSAALILDPAVYIPYYLEKLRLYGWNIDLIYAENIESINLEKYDYIIAQKKAFAAVRVLNFEERLKHPEKFVSRCTYYDNNFNKVYNIEKKKMLTKAVCEIPFEYFKQNGFIEDENIKSSIITVLKRE